MQLKLAFLMIVAPDLRRAKDFYGAVLGFPLKSETAERLAFTHAGADLVVFKGTCDAPPIDHGGRASTTFVFEVPDLAAAMADLKTRGVRFLHATPARNEWGLYAAFVDPFGNVLELMQRA
ncbi:MAG TPA: VOC family protein [Rhizomicrobium sp.]|nr:VOC family protein [Rhizomicrobium sp.]